MTHATTYADANLAAFVRTCLSEGISLEQAERLLEMTFEEVEAWEGLGPVAPLEHAEKKELSAQLSRIRGLQDATQNSMVNAPFASVGGLSVRGELKAPSYISADDADAYLKGYREAVRRIYGDDCQTAELGWKPALTLPGTAEGQST